MSAWASDAARSMHIATTVSCQRAPMAGFLRGVVEAVLASIVVPRDNRDKQKGSIAMGQSGPATLASLVGVMTRTNTVRTRLPRASAVVGFAVGRPVVAEPAYLTGESGGSTLEARWRLFRAAAGSFHTPSLTLLGRWHFALPDNFTNDGGIFLQSAGDLLA